MRPIGHTQFERSEKVRAGLRQLLADYRRLQDEALALVDYHFRSASRAKERAAMRKQFLDRQKAKVNTQLLPAHVPPKNPRLRSKPKRA